ncbi:MAG: hypothetical protein QNK30_06970 [Bacteroidales bacterium]|nr:hypothetical protein [Bacteroidales bacterium]
MKKRNDKKSKERRAIHQSSSFLLNRLNEGLALGKDAILRVGIFFIFCYAGQSGCLRNPEEEPCSHVPLKFVSFPSRLFLLLFLPWIAQWTHRLNWQ